MPVVIDGPVEFDTEKDLANFRKHGISLHMARAFDGADTVVVEDGRRDYGEPRSIAYGRIGGRLHVMVFTRRGEMVRVISLRKANAREVKRYGAG